MHLSGRANDACAESAVVIIARCIDVGMKQLGG